MINGPTARLGGSSQDTGAAARVARGISHVLSPAGIAVLILAAAGASEHTGWGAVAIGVALFAVAPALALQGLARRARLTDVYDPPPGLRQRMLMVGTGCYAAGWALSAALGLGPALSWVASTFAVGAAVVWGVDRLWKISIHNTGAGGGAVLLSGFLAPSLAPACWALPLVVGWARWRRGAHSPAQLVAGALLGAAASRALQGLYG